MLLWSSNGTPPTTTFDAGETYVVPSQGGLLTGSLVIYAADQDAGAGGTAAAS